MNWGAERVLNVQKQCLLIFIGILGLLVVPAMGDAAPNIEWQRCYGGTLLDTCSKVITTPDNGVLVLVDSTSFEGDFTHGSNLLKCNEDGTIDWVTSLNSTNDMYLSDSGDIYTCGQHLNYLLIEKRDLSGTVEWSKLFDGPGITESGSKIKPTLDNGFIIIGATGYPDNNWFNPGTMFFPWIVKIDADGNKEWDRQFGNGLTDLVSLSNGDYYLLGTISQERLGGGDQYNISITKIDSDGEFVWPEYRYYGGSYDDTPASLQPYNTGFVLTSFTRSNDGNVTGNHGDADIWVVLADSEGNIQHEMCYGGSHTDYPVKSFVLETGEIEIIGFSDSTDGNLAGIKTLEERQLWILRISNSGAILRNNVYSIGEFGDILRMPDSSYYLFSSMANPTNPSWQSEFTLTHISADGTLDWQKIYGGSGYDRAVSFSQTIDGYFYLGGYTNSNDGDVGWYQGGTSYDVWVAKLSDRENPLPLLLASAPDQAHHSKGDPVVINVLGTGLSPNAQISLQYNQGASISASSVSQISPTELSASFNLAGIPGGVYDITLINPDGGTSTLLDVFTYIGVNPVDSEWNIQKIADLSVIGNGRPGIVLDTDDNPHILYTTDLKNLNYSYYSGATWQNTTIFQSDQDRYISHYTIALDQSSNPHVVFQDCGDAGDYKIIHMYKTTSGWITNEISDGISGGVMSRMVIGSDGSLHLIYNGNSSQLIYSRYDGTSWHSEIVTYYGGQLKIDVDALNNPKIMFEHGSSPSGSYSGEIAYCTKINEVWNSIHVADTSIGNNFYAFALNSEGIPYALYSPGWGGDVHLVYLKDGVWKNDIVYWGSVGTIGQSLDFTSEDNPVFLLDYYNQNTSLTELNLFIAADGEWTQTIVDPDGNTGFCVIDSKNNPHAVYYSTNVIKYATITEETLPIELILYVHETTISGVPINNVQIEGKDGSGKSFSGTTDTSGKIIITGNSGIWHFKASKPGYVESEWDNEITDPQTRHAFLVQQSDSPLYNAQAAVEYANIWGGAERNPLYHDYSDEGGDCANFVSQCLIAGGSTLDTYTDAWGSIVSCDSLDAWLKSKGYYSEEILESHTPSEPFWFSPGDVAIYGNADDKFKHAIITVGRNADNNALCNGHTPDMINQPIGYLYNYNDWDRSTFYRLNSGPFVKTFKINPLSNSLSEKFNITGMVSAGDGETLQQVELWRNDGDPSNENEWKRIDPVVAIPPGQTDYSYSFEDSPDVAGDYWYGIHVVDSNTWAHEGGGQARADGKPIKVTIYESSQSDPPKLVTDEADQITGTSAILRGHIENPVPGQIYTVCFRYEGGSTPKTKVGHSSISGENPDYEYKISNLIPGTTYNYRAVHKDSDGPVNPNPIDADTHKSFTTCKGIDPQIITYLNTLIPDDNSQYFDKNWKITPEQYKLMILTLIWGEGGKYGFTAHSGKEGEDRETHKNVTFYFSSGIGPFQLDWGGEPDSWENWPTIEKLNWQRAFESTLKIHKLKLNQKSINNLEDVRIGLRDTWYAYYRSDEQWGHWEVNWPEITGTNWDSVKYSNRDSERLLTNSQKPIRILLILFSVIG